MSAIVNQEAADTIADLHRGLHVVMTALIKDRDYDKAELVLHQMDQSFTRFIHEAKTIRIQHD